MQELQLVDAIILPFLGSFSKENQLSTQGPQGTKEGRRYRPFTESSDRTAGVSILQSLNSGVVMYSRHVTKSIAPFVESVRSNRLRNP